MADVGRWLDDVDFESFKWRSFVSKQQKHTSYDAFARVWI